MGGGEDGGAGRAEAAPAAGVIGVAGPPSAWPDGSPAGAPPTAWPDGTPAGGPPPASPPPAAPPGGVGGAWPPPAPSPTRPLGGAWHPTAAPPSPAPTRRRGRDLLTALAVLAAVVAVATAVVLADPLGGGADESAASWRSDADAEDLAPQDDTPAETPAEAPAERPAEPTTTLPPPTTTAPPVRLAPAPVAPAEAGPHTFFGREDDGDPIAWDPCETIRFVVNSRTAPPGAAELVAEAMAQVSAATGLVFEDAGATDEVPLMEGRPPTDAVRYGEGWAPVLVAWTDPAEVTELGGDIAGWGGPDWMPVGLGEFETVTGIVYLDGPQVAEMLAQGWRTDALDLVLHELGHMIGLDHVDDPGQLMYHNRDGRGAVRGTWNTGDLTGLAALGTGDCNPDI